MAPRYKLKLKQLDFVSLVDDPAQPNAKCLLIKRKGAAVDVTATARLVKTSDELGLAFFWAFTSTNPDGTDHYDLHGDAVQADNDMIKAAADFMEKGGSVDEMHDSESTGRVVFAMPMTPEIAKAFGVETKTSGLMVAIRPSADAMAKLKDGTYRAVSIAGLGERIEARKSRIVKGSLYTDEVEGHQHKVCIYEDGGMYVEWATMAGATQGHSHGVVFEDGKLTILADSGHTHELAEGQAGIAVVPADAIVIVSPTKNAAPVATAANKSTQPPAPDHGRSNMETKLIVLTDAQHAHYAKLAGAEAEAFLSKSSAERDTVLADIAKADAVVFKGELTGIEVRKSHGPMAMQLAELAEKNAAVTKAQAETIAKRDEAIEKAEVAKAASDLFKNAAPGADEAHQDIVRALRKSGLSAERLGAAMAALTGLVNESAIGKAAPGVNPGGDPQPANTDEALAKFTKGLEAYAKANNIPNVWTDARAAFVKTDEGAALSRAYNESLNG